MEDLPAYFIGEVLYALGEFFSRKKWIWVILFIIIALGIIVLFSKVF